MKTTCNYPFAALLILGGIFASSSPVDACTGICIKPKDGSVICARTLEFGIDLQANILVIPRNKAFVGTTPDNKPGLRWTTKYGITGTNAFNMPMIADGLNEKGLAIGIFYFPGYAKFQQVGPNDAAQAIASHELPLFLLSTCANVDEAVAAVRKVRVAEVRLPGVEFALALHYVVHDADGRCAVVEYVDGQLHVYDNPLGVLTNCPTFDWQITNLSNYINLTANNVPPAKMSGLTFSGFGQGTGMLGLPGDFTPPSRFVRAVAFSQSALPVATAQEGVLQAFHILNQFDIPKGAARNVEQGKVVADYTSWTSASDLKNHRYYFHTYQNRQIRMIDLGQVDLDAKDIKTISMDQEESIENLSNAAK